MARLMAMQRKRTTTSQLGGASSELSSLGPRSSTIRTESRGRGFEPDWSAPRFDHDWSAPRFENGPAAATAQVTGGGDGAGPSASASGATAPVALRSDRFKGDSTLELVMRNLRTLLRGSKGNAVQKVQRALIDAGFPLPKFGPDGDFGGETEQAVKDFQGSVGLTGDDQDGKVGPKTLGQLDNHFATQGQAAQLGPGPGSPSAISFETPDPQPAKFQGPSEARKDNGRILLQGSQFSLTSPVTARAADPVEASHWEVGHVQDMIAFGSIGTYRDGHTISVAPPVPIRDALSSEPKRFPWYQPHQVHQAVLDTPVTAFHLDRPDTQFPSADAGSTLAQIQLSYALKTWVTARNRNTGETRFLQNVAWGSTTSLTIPASLNLADVPDDARPDVAVGKVVDLPPPAFTDSPINQSVNVGSPPPTLTEAIFNDVANPK